jgi:hypothetical protein
LLRFAAYPDVVERDELWMRLWMSNGSQGKGRYIVLDSDRPWYQPADELLAGWQVRRFTG